MRVKRFNSDRGNARKRNKAGNQDCFSSNSTPWVAKVGLNIVPSDCLKTRMWCEGVTHKTYHYENYFIKHYITWTRKILFFYTNPGRESIKYLSII